MRDYETLREAEIEAILREYIFLKTPRGGKTNASIHGYLSATYALAEEGRKRIVYEDEVTAKFISTPSLACNFLALKGGLFDGVKIPIDAARGTLLDRQRLRIYVMEER